MNREESEGVRKINCHDIPKYTGEGEREEMGIVNLDI